MKLIFLDIDGTLTLPGRHDPPESALRAIRSAQALGNKVFLCTGRGMCMLEPLLKYGFDGVIALTGGYVVVDGKVIYDCPMNEKEVEKILELLHNDGVFCTLEANHCCYGDLHLREFYHEDTLPMSEAVIGRIENMVNTFRVEMNVNPMKDRGNEPIYKVVLFCDKEEQLLKAREQTEQDFEYLVKYVDFLGFLNGELINRKFDKGQAIQRVCKELGVSIEDTYGFGDGLNDIGMMKVVGTSVCMENGEDELKKICKVVCPSVTDDGIAKAFSQLGLSE